MIDYIGLSNGYILKIIQEDEDLVFHTIDVNFLLGVIEMFNRENEYE